MKELNMICAGDKISFNNFQSIFSAAGPNTRISLTDPNSMPQAELVALLKSAGSKKLSLSLTAGKASHAQLVAICEAAVGTGTHVSIESINSLPIAATVQLAAIINDKNWSIDIDGATTSSANAVSIINLLTGPALTITFRALNALTGPGSSDVVYAIGNKNCSIMLDGKMSTPARIIECIEKIASSNSHISLANGGALSPANLIQIISAIGDKSATLSFDLLDINANSIFSVLGAIGGNVSISIISAHTLSTTENTQLRRLMEGKQLSVEFNGRQLGVDPVNGDRLQQVINASNTDTTIIVNTAQYPPLSYLLPAIQSSSNTNLVVSYNGGQLTDTEAGGNIVLQALEISPASTSIVVISVGDGNYSVDNYVAIVRAAG